MKEMEDKISVKLGKAFFAVGIWLVGMLLLALLTSDLTPGCYQTYPKVAFGIALYESQAITIILLGLIGLLLTYVRIFSRLYKNVDPRQILFGILPIYLISILLILVLVSYLGCV
ncbi:MAG: hypothetical protein KGH71_03040 [Candidatus Micrarchaeota archaeon]|nr:hypothetical protein [Candidatus Micrarchaeota archaeon]